MNTLLNLLGLGVLNGGTNYLAENMWDKQMNSLVKDRQEIGRFSSDLNAAKKSALNTALALGDNSTIPLFLSSIGNKAGPTKYKSDFASSLISGISDSLRQANYGLFKLKKKPTTAEITPAETVAVKQKTTMGPSLPTPFLTSEQQQLIDKYSNKDYALNYMLNSHNSLYK